MFLLTVMTYETGVRPITSESPLDLTPDPAGGLMTNQKVAACTCREFPTISLRQRFIPSLLIASPLEVFSGTGCSLSTRRAHTHPLQEMKQCPLSQGIVPRSLAFVRWSRPVGKPSSHQLQTSKMAISQEQSSVERESGRAPPLRIRCNYGIRFAPTPRGSIMASER